jgi:hypothetical protein
MIFTDLYACETVESRDKFGWSLYLPETPYRVQTPVEHENVNAGTVIGMPLSISHPLPSGLLLWRITALIDI